ncbi:MAG: hypothetical protein WBK75_02035 [Acutalibacteraceae bacterium]|jgi:hypothetical protein
MKKTILTLTMILMFTILVTACDKDKKNDVKTSQKATTNKSEKVEVKTTVIEVTDSTGEPVTNAKGEKVTQVVTIPPTTKKDKSNQDTTPTTTKSNKATTKAPPKNTTTRAAAQPPKAPTTTSQGMSHWVTQVSQNPYGYANAWGTLAQMENDCKAYAESIGLIYNKDVNLDTGHWITPLSSYGATSSEHLKNKLFEDIKFEKERTDITNTEINLIFVTMDNYKDGRCVSYEKETAELYLCGTTDKIIVYFVVG